MKTPVLTLLAALAFCLLACQPEKANDNIVTQDIEYFWEAYDSITTTTDTAAQRALLEELYFARGTEGLAAIRAARRYSAEDYLTAIRSYPAYWSSIRPKTQQVDDYARDIQRGIDQFKELYPSYRPAKVYFEIGAFRTNGTTMDSLVLIGAEMAMGDAEVDVSELPARMQYVKDYLQTNPNRQLPFLMVHEYVHTQQTAAGGYDLLSQCVYEGIPEFLAELATGEASPNEAISFGKANDERVRERFAQEIGSPFFYHWIWNDTNNEFGVRDLGYYIGYAIAQRYYERAADKQEAIKVLLALDYNDPEAIEAFVEETGYFPQPLATYKAAFRQKRPVVTGLEPDIQGQTGVDAGLRAFTVYFSEPLDTRFTSNDFGPGGRETLLPIDSVVFADEGRSAVLHTRLQPGRTYELELSYGYRTTSVVPLLPYLISFSTRK